MSDDPNPNGTDPKDPNSAGTGGAGDPPKDPPKDPINYEDKFKESQKEAIRLAKELKDLKNPPNPKSELPEDEKKVREIFSKLEQEKADLSKKEQEELKSDLDKLHTVHGDFDNKKLLTIVERYGVYDNDGKVLWERAMELYERLGGVAEPAPKKKVGERTKDGKPEVDLTKDLGKKSMSDIVKEGLKHFGIGGQ